MQTRDNIIAFTFAERTSGRAYATVLSPSVVVCRLYGIIILCLNSAS